MLLTIGSGACQGGTLYTCMDGQGKSLQSSSCPDGTEVRRRVAEDQPTSRKLLPLVDVRPTKDVLQRQPYNALGRMFQGKPPI